MTETSYAQLILNLRLSNCISSALFHAEQFYAEFQSELSAFTYASLLQTCNNWIRITQILDPRFKSLRCRNVLAEAYRRLGRHSEALKTLEGYGEDDNFDDYSNSNNNHLYGVDGDHLRRSNSYQSNISGALNNNFLTMEIGRMYLLKAYIYKDLQNYSKVKEELLKALKTCPLLYEAFVELLSLGETVELHPSSILESIQQQQQLLQQEHSQVVSKKEIIERKKIQSQNSQVPQGKSVRKSSRLHTNPNSSTLVDNNNRVLREKKRNRNGEYLQEEPNINNNSMDVDSKPIFHSVAETQNSEKEEMEYSRIMLLATNYHSIMNISLKIMNYDVFTALKLLQSLPEPMQQTSSVLALKAQCFVKNVRYKEAKEEFEKLSKMDDLEQMPLYSTTLWHLKDQTSLSALAQKLMQTHRNTPEAWCVLGNCFSLQKKHDEALMCFERATRINQRFAYAYNLAGHENTSIEAYEKALDSFRNAIKYNPRLYNSWYGLGVVYYRQEKWQLALYHFQHALRMNPRSSILKCFLGMVLHKMERFDEALSVLNAGISLDEFNPQIRYRKAQVLFQMKRFEEALFELDKVSALAPHELNVYYRKGQILSALNDKERALKEYLKAMDFQSPAVKTAIDKLQTSG